MRPRLGATVQGPPKECFPGLVNLFVTAVGYHFCLNLTRAFSQPGKLSFGDPSILRDEIGVCASSLLPSFANHQTKEDGAEKALLAVTYNTPHFTIR